MPRRTRLIFLIVAVLLLMLLFACEPNLKEGWIYNKSFYPSHTDMVMIPITTTTGKTTSTTYIWVPVYYPDSYTVDIKKFDGKKWQRAEWWIDRETYYQLQIGGYFKVRPTDMDEQPKEVRQ